MSQYWHRRVLCGTRARNRVVRKRNMAIDIYATSPHADGAVPARGLTFRALAIGAFLLLLIGIAAGGWAVNLWLVGSNLSPAPKMVGAPAGAANPLLTGGAAKGGGDAPPLVVTPVDGANALAARVRSEEHTSEIKSLMRISYAVFCLKKKQKISSTQGRHSTQQK